MKTRFIRIKDISEVDTTKCTVYDLNKRFIDEHGKMFALRYNKDQKKVEVFQIMRTASKNAAYFTQRVFDRKKASQEAKEFESEMEEASFDDLDSHEDNMENLTQDNEYEYPKNENTNSDFSINQTKFEPDVFIEKILNLLKIHKERYKGIKINIQSTGISEFQNRDISANLDEIMRNIEIDGDQKIDKVVSNCRELTEYPRSLTYYMGKLDSKSRDIVDKLYSDAKRLKFIYYYEMNNSFWELFKTEYRLLNKLKNFILEHNEEILSKLSSIQRQNLSDAQTTIENTIAEALDALEELKQLEYLIKNPKALKNN